MAPSSTKPVLEQLKYDLLGRVVESISYKNFQHTIINTIQYFKTDGALNESPDNLGIISTTVGYAGAADMNSLVVINDLGQQIEQIQSML
jgi:hypothetical protein